MVARSGGVTRVVARVVAPEQVLEGRITRLLGVLWTTGGLWVILGLAGGLAVAGSRAAVFVVGVTALVVGCGLLLLRGRELPLTAYLALTALGGAAISLTVLWGGPVGAATFGVLFVYVSCFSFIALRAYAVVLVGGSAALHLAALWASDHPHVLGVWAATWGAAVVTGLLASTAVEWLGDTLLLLERADEHRTRFVATVSHELRTPLAAILGSTETLQLHWSRLDDDQRSQLIQVIHRQAGRQLRLVEDVLAVTTQMAEAAPPAPVDVRLADVLERAAGEMQFPVGVECPTAVHAIVDPDHLRQVVENLLVNADRYGDPPVEVRVSADEDEVVVVVVDHGPGIPGGLDSGLLEPFVQGDSGDRRTSAGVGLGLTICRDLVAANRGRLSYSDTPGGGATFHVTLPRGRHH